MRKSMLMRSAWWCLLALGVVLSSCGVADTSTAAVPPTAVPTYDWQLAEMGLDAGPTPTLRPADATAEAGMNRSRTAEARIRATAAGITPQPKTSRPSNQRSIQVTPSPKRAWPTGIYECNYENMTLRIIQTTCWHELRDNVDIIVVVGGKNFHPGETETVESALVVYHGHQFSDIFWLRDPEGFLTITAVTWPHITVRSAIGKEHGFNAETLEWETPQATPTTPTPTGTPTPTSSR